MSSQLWQLLHLGYPMAKLVTTVKLLEQVPWTTLPCEQLHGSLSVFRRWHPEFWAVPLVSRAIMLQVSRIIFPSISKAEKELANVIQRIRRLCAKQTHMTRATSHLVAEIFSSLRHRHGNDSVAPDTC